MATKIEEQVGLQSATERRAGKLGQQVGIKPTVAAVQRREEAIRKAKEEAERKRKELEKTKESLSGKSLADYSTAYSELPEWKKEFFITPEKAREDQQAKIQETREKLRVEAKEAQQKYEQKKGYWDKKIDRYYDDLKEAKKEGKERSVERYERYIKRAKIRETEDLEYYSKYVRELNKMIGRVSMDSPYSFSNVKSYARDVARSESRKEGQETKLELEGYSQVGWGTGKWVKPEEVGLDPKSVGTRITKEELAKEGIKYKSGEFYKEVEVPSTTPKIEPQKDIELLTPKDFGRVKEYFPETKLQTPETEFTQSWEAKTFGEKIKTVTDPIKTGATKVMEASPFNPEYYFEPTQVKVTGEFGKVTRIEGFKEPAPTPTSYFAATAPMAFGATPRTVFYQPAFAKGIAIKEARFQIEDLGKQKVRSASIAEKSTGKVEIRGIQTYKELQREIFLKGSLQKTESGKILLPSSKGFYTISGTVKGGGKAFPVTGGGLFEAGAKTTSKYFGSMGDIQVFLQKTSSTTIPQIQTYGVGTSRISFVRQLKRNLVTTAPTTKEFSTALSFKLPKPTKGFSEQYISFSPRTTEVTYVIGAPPKSYGITPTTITKTPFSKTFGTTQQVTTGQLGFTPSPKIIVPSPKLTSTSLVPKVITPTTTAIAPPTLKTSLKEETKQIGIPKLKTVGTTKTTTLLKNIQGVKGISSLRTIQPSATIQKPREVQQTKVTQISTQKQISQGRYGSAIIPLPTPRIDLGKGGLGGGRIIPPPPFSFKTPKRFLPRIKTPIKRRGTRVTRKPSLVALGQQIKAPRIESSTREATGLVIRPIVERKKKKKKGEWLI